MADMSLEDLQAQLQAVQQKKSTVRLSERNVVELVNKLKELGFLGSELLYTMNGQEYITRDQLKKEIQDALQVAGGRLALSDLPTLLNVDLAHCEHVAKSIISESDGTTTLLQGDLVTSQYFDGVGIEINDMLQETGMVRVGDFAIHFALSSEMILSLVTPRIGTVIDGRLAGGMLYTPMYVARLKAQLRGALRGVTSPTALSKVLKLLRLDGSDSGVGAIVSTLVEELIRERAVKGSLKVGGSWVPDIHQRAQRGALKSFYNHNGWVALDSMQRAGIATDASSVEDAFPGSITLDSTVVAPGVLAQVDMAIQEVASTGTWCDVASLTPTSLTHTDIAMLMLNFPAVKVSNSAADVSGCTVVMLAGTCAVSASLVEDAQKRAVEDAKSLAVEAFKKRQQESAGASASGVQQRSRAGQPENQKEEADDSDEEWDTGKSKGKKKGKAKAKAKAKGKSQTGGQSKGAGGDKGPPDADTTLLPTPDKLVSKFVEWYPDLDEGGDPTNMLRALAEQTCPAAVTEYHATMQIAMGEASQGRREIKDKAFKGFGEEMQHFWLYLKGAKHLENNESTHALVHRHLIKTTGTDALDWLLRFIQLHDPNEEVADPLVPIQPTHRSNIVKQLPANVSKAAEAAVQATKGGDAQALYDTIEKAGEAFALRLKKMDRKLERQLVTELKTRLKEELARSTTPAACLALVVPFLFAQIHNSAVSIPGKAIAGVLLSMKADMEEDAYLLLDEFHKLVVASLKEQSRSAPISPEEVAEVLQVKLAMVKAALGIEDRGGTASGSAVEGV
eukprot:evm.model.scf_1673.1 EVM.evm.TU.scf_1673.1   scf_1673:10433-21504(-)